MMKQIPNILTLSRVVASLIVPILIFSNGEIERMLALIIFIIAAHYLITLMACWLGILEWSRALAKSLDPIADKLLLAGMFARSGGKRRLGMGSFCASTAHSCYEKFLFQACAKSSAQDNISIPVTPLAKLKTATQLLALVAAISAPLMASTTMDILTSFMLFWVAAILTVRSGWGYFKGALRE